MIESEKNLEKKLAQEVKNLGGWCIKLVCLHIAGLPDRLCLMPEGKLFFVEVKTTKKKPKKIQAFVHTKIRKLGFKVYIVDNSDYLHKILKDYE